MQERDTDGKIRSTLLNAEVQAPDFDTLFGKDALGSDSLRSALASKLANHTSKAPDFNSLFAGETLGKPVQAPKIRIFPWWSIAGVAAACMAVLFLLPKQLGTEMKQLTKAPVTEQVQSPVKRVIKIHSAVQPRQMAQLLTTPSTIKPLRVEKKNTSVLESMAETSEKTTSEVVAVRDTNSSETLTKIKPRRSSLFVKLTLSLIHI